VKYNEERRAKKGKKYGMEQGARLGKEGRRAGFSGTDNKYNKGTRRGFIVADDTRFYFISEPGWESINCGLIIVIIGSY
jgi:hypothetical protein